MTYFIISLCIASFSLAHLLNTLGFYVRVSGRFSGNIFYSHALEKYIQFGSITFLGIFVPLLAYITESLFSTEKYSMLVTLALIFSGLLTLTALFWGPFIFSWASQLVDSGAKAPANLPILSHISLHFKLRSENSLLRRLQYKNLHRRFFLIGVAINFFLGSGFFFAYYFASIFHENRLTIAQLSIVIHGVGTLLQNVIAEPRIAIILDDSGRDDWQNAVESYILGKGAAFFLIYFIFLGIGRVYS